ncbi:SDR family oxidoreductase [Altererythrobacter arenosus]|uniref:SDR family oxidoreductase n=1 Tax=Altererythrobacter arenosus TaxID=3032592 RepID=A0ABY8FSE9_9SPHN|nr:SDR family oxidoreductase [Altererythrobacter sp. CAU 1644]WFL77000.1 SDR family oxidoreductase [Altererythrobacter sp. CAU 1644]
MPDVTRRSLMTGIAATGALAATTSLAQGDALEFMPDLSGKSILITGCSSGFGRLGAEHYARLGAKVFATMRNTPRPEAEELIAVARNDDLDIEVLRLDVNEPSEIEDAVTYVDRALGGGAIDVLINNAGIGITSPVEIQDMEATRLIFETNVFGPHRLARAFLPGMRERGSGQIIQISSQLGRVIVPYSGHYSATKFALESMSEQLAYELVPHNIDVTIIEPGGYPTKVWVNRNMYSAALKARTPDHHAAGYPAQFDRMGHEDGSGRSADPMDVPRAIAKLIAMPQGTRPLRQAVSGGSIPQLAINEVCAETQVGWLGRSPALGPLMRAVHKV